VDAVLYQTLTEVRAKDPRSDVEPDRLLTQEAARSVGWSITPALLPSVTQISRYAMLDEITMYWLTNRFELPRDCSGPPRT
jgi:hypothetical protein